ncbi:MAG: glycosyltransferase [Desulfovibrionaceae bacterium]|nr:glycosyltransferase [Desulfovibrionaceae bacterium]
MHRVSVIIPCYNMERYVNRAIQSALAQQSETIDVEVIVVDDGSTDNSFADLSLFPPTVKILRQDNKGSSAARNAGLKIATGDYIQFLDADDILPRGVLASQVQALSLHLDWDFSVSLSVQMNENTGKMYFWPLRASHLDIHLCQKNITPPHAILMRHIALDSVGYFDTTLSACVDHDFIVRCALAGKRFGVNPEGLVVYWLHSGTISRNEENVARNASIVCSHIGSLLHARDNVPLSGRGQGFLAYAVGLLSTGFRIKPFDERLALQMTSKSVSALQEACAYGLSSHDPYIETCVQFFIAQYLSMVRSEENQMGECKDSVRLLSYYAPNLATLDTEKLFEIVKKLDLRLNCPLQLMQQTLSRYPEVRAIQADLRKRVRCE